MAITGGARFKTESVLRLAIAMRGGVSLAVWIGGALREIDRLQRPKSDPFVRALLNLTVFHRAEIDILTGASAGGLNAALGGYAIARGHQMDLRDVWMKTADIDRLLEPSGPTSRRSILDGSYFLDQVRARVEKLAVPPVAGNANGKPVEMFLAATVFGGLPVSEPLDPLFSDRRSEAVFHFRHLADSPSFSDLADGGAAGRVATAARSTASFPAAFEPVEVGTRVFSGELLLPQTGRVPEAMRLIDGGVVDNIPVARAIRAAAAAPASEPVRRCVVFLHPSPDELGARPAPPDPGEVPSILAVARDLLSGVGETLLDDLEYLRMHNRDAESQKLERYSLCAHALKAPGKHAQRNGLASVDADCLYGLLDDPPSMLPWIPIGEAPPRSPIGGWSNDAKYALRTGFLEDLLRRPDTVRPFARIVRSAHLIIEWIRWAEQQVRVDFASERRLVYDTLLVATLLDAALANIVLAADNNHLKVLERTLEAVESAPALHELVGALGRFEAPGADPMDPLFQRLLDDRTRVTLEALARGRIPDRSPDGDPASHEVSDAMLEHLTQVCKSIVTCTREVDATESIFTLLGRTIGWWTLPRRIKSCILAVDHATAGLHRGRAIGAPQTLDYLRVSGAAASPLATPDVPLDPVPRFDKIRVTDGGWIDPSQKLAGNKLANFSAFISPRFRANDWMWGRMDAATAMVNHVVSPDYLRRVPIKVQMASLRRLLTCSFGAAYASPESVTGSAEAVCCAMWEQYAPAIELELSKARLSSDPETLAVTREMVQTRWHLEILVQEMPAVLAQPAEPGATSTAESVWESEPSGEAASAAASKQRLKRLMESYERGPRRVSDLWGRRKTTALGVRFARQAARGLVPHEVRLALFKRTAIAAPLLVVVAALLSRGAFLIAWNALVGIVLLPRLAATARLTVGLISLVLSFLFWLKLVKRKRRNAWRGWVSGIVAFGLLAAGVLGIWVHRWPVRAPTHFTGPGELARWQWMAFSHWDSVIWPSIILAAGSALAVICLWVWAKPWVIVAAAVTVGLVMGWWAILGAWQPPNPQKFQQILAGLGSMWIPAVLLAIVFTVIAVRFRLEDRPGSAKEVDEMPGARSQDKPTEVRVHGVGGSPGPALLGYENPQQAPILAWPAPGVVVRQRADESHGIVQGFDWGSLNSNWRFQALWVFLLPFTLLNVAGWAVPRLAGGLYRKLARVIQFLVVLLGWVLTMTVALWVADLLIGYLGYQWLPRALGAADGRATFNPVGSWSVTLTLTTVRSIGVGLGAFLSLVLFIVVSVVARRAKSGSQEPRYNAESFGPDPSLSDQGFFDRRASRAASKILHLVLACASLIMVAARAVSALRASPSPPRIDAGTTLVIIGGVQLFLLLVLGVVALVVRMGRREPGPGVAWAFAVMAFALTNMFFSGLVVWSSKYLSIHPAVTGQPGMIPGNDLAIVDAYFLVAALWVLIAVVLVLYRTHIGGLPAVCEPGGEIHEEWVKPILRAQGAARIIHKIDRLVVAFAAVFLAASVGFGCWRAGVFEGKPPWEWNLAAPNQNGLAYTAAAWLLPAFVVFVMVRVRKAASDNQTRRFIGQVWDVLSFWPRRFHPFAVRPYSHIAVPALREHIAQRLETGPVVVSAHSQGSILAVAALSQLPDLSRVGLVTYGSHVGTLYRRAFGAYFDEECIGQLHARLGGQDGERWQNLFRLTDPVGGQIFGGAADHCVPDPAIAVAQPGRFDPPLEQDREPWADLAIHSYYLKERALKTCVREMEDGLTLPAAMP